MDTNSARWSLRLFGDFQLTERAVGEKVAVPGKRERVLLAYLALSPNGRQPRRKLVTLLWGEAADETTLENLRTSVFNLRKALGDTEHRIIASEDRDIVLDASAFEVDVLEFRRLVAGGGAAELEEAAKLYCGDFLDGLSIESEEFESWRREQCTRCKGQALDALTRLMAQLAAEGESERAIEAGLRTLRLEPLHESAVRRLMRLYAESGRRTAAVELYQSVAEALKKELGAQPEAETAAVYEQITRSYTRLAPATADTESSLPSPTITPLRDARSAPSPAHYSPPAVDIATPIARDKARRLTISWLLGGGLAAAATVAMLLFMPFTPSESPAPIAAPSTVVAATPTSAIALAVLPLQSLSAEQDQEFFSDGLTDEITLALAKVPNLRIVARTSAFEFKGLNRNIRTIGEQLGATHLIEGSVRRAGDRVRIAVQLVRAEDGTQIWTDDYDRQLTDIFAIQEDIATAVASALRVPLGLGTSNALVPNRNIDPESYQQYLRAKPLSRSSGREVAQAIAILEPVVASNPDYAPAWALLASGYSGMPSFVSPAGFRSSGDERRRRMDEYWPKAETAARRAIQLDPNLADGYLAQGKLDRVRGKLVSADDLFSKALALDPNNSDALYAYMLHLSNVGRLQEALAAGKQLHSLEPYVPRFNSGFSFILWENGQNDTAIEMLRPVVAGSVVPGAAPQNLAMIYASMGRYSDSADVIDANAGNLSQPFEDLNRMAAGLLRQAPAKSQNIPRFRVLSWLHLYVGNPERALEYYEDTVSSGEVGGSAGDNGFLWHQSYAPVRKTDRFKAYVRSAGLVEYWRAKGWPEFCRPTTGNDFECT